MWWIIGIIILLVLVFLWLIVRSAAHSIDDDTQDMLDDEQSKYIQEYFDKQAKQDEKGRDG